MKITGAAVAVVAALVASLALTSVAGAGARNGALREFEGKVVSVDAAAKTFRLEDHHRGVKTIQVSGRTRFEDLAGFSALRPGLRRVEAKVKRVDGAWVARKVELSGRDDDDDRAGDDDNGGDRHGGDDRGDDDNGGGRHGGDDDSGHGGGDDD